MARMKDLMIDLRNLELGFVDVLANLFEREGYVVLERETSFTPSGGPDLAVGDDGHEHILVEIKLHRSERVPLALLRNAFSHLNNLVAERGAIHGILFVTQPVPEALYASLERGKSELWDLGALVAKVRPHRDLSDALGELVRALRVGADKLPSDAPAASALVEPEAAMPPPGAGAKIADALETCPSGNKEKAANRFEELCEEALKLLYGGDFLGWKRQSHIEEGFQRLDLIARLVPVRDRFWATLAADFHTRYVIFEFKNYSERITQDEVYATEKYLFTTALRAVAIIVARNGASDSAHRAMRGALREQGKLILCVSMEELCALLRGYDNGDDPTNLLVDKVDEMLMSIAR